MPSAMSSPPSTRLQVDQLILDYLLWYLIETLLTEHNLSASSPSSPALQSASKTADTAIKLAHSFYQTYTHTHLTHTPLPTALKLRLLTARSLLSLLRRLSLPSPDFSPQFPSSIRTHRWISHHSTPPTTSLPVPPPPSASTLATNRASFLQSSRATERMYGSLTLRDVTWDLLCLLAAVSAPQAGGLERREQWVGMLGGMMRSAVWEGVGILGEEGEVVVREATAFGGYEVWEGMGEEGEEEVGVNDFWVEVVGMREWERVKEMVMGEGVVGGWGKEEEEVTGVRAVEEVERIARSLRKPVLGQLEDGRLEGWREGEVKGLLESMGVAGEVWP